GRGSRTWPVAGKGGGELKGDLARGGGGDRFRLYEPPTGPALVLYTVWDASVSARGFANGPAARFVARAKPGYRTTAESIDGAGRFAVRVGRAPTVWERWGTLPPAAVLA